MVQHRHRFGSFNSQPPEGGWQHPPKLRRPIARFNSQPPEGGWLKPPFYWSNQSRFNSQPPEGGWLHEYPFRDLPYGVSTHSRPKAAGFYSSSFNLGDYVSTHSRPKAAGGFCWWFWA